MPLYTAFDLTSPPSPAGGALQARVAGLDAQTADVLSALFEADGSTAEALRMRAHATRAAVDGALGTLEALGYAERDGDAVWLTGAAFGLRRAVRRAGNRVPFRRG